MDRMLARLWGSKHKRRGAATEGFLAAMMHGGTVASSDLGGGQRAYETLSRMARRGYVERQGGRSAGCRYRITLRGKAKAACCALRLGFVALCALAEARAMHAMQDECGVAREYPVCMLERALEGLYAPKTVRNAASELCAAGMAAPVREGVISLRAGRFGGFEPVLDELHFWVAGAREQISAAALGDPRSVAALRGAGP